MRRRHARSIVTAASVVLAGAVPPLLTRMRREFHRDGRLRPPTIVGMYAAYTVGAVAVGVAARHRLGPLPVRSRTLRGIGAATGVAGAALMAAGMRRFDSARQLSGADHPDLVTGGVYRITRNPQYVGGVVALVGLAAARRSLVMAGLATGWALVARAWVPVEEANLERRFGDAYRRYHTRTPRWLRAPRRDDR